PSAKSLSLPWSFRSIGGCGATLALGGSGNAPLGRLAETQTVRKVGPLPDPLLDGARRRRSDANDVGSRRARLEVPWNTHDLDRPTCMSRSSPLAPGHSAASADRST